MQFFVSSSLSFSAAHQLEDVENHDQVHGHVYAVEVTCLSRYDQAKKRVAQDPAGIHATLKDILAELHNRDLNVMLTGAEPTLEGVAAWVMDRMALNWPVVRCSVTSEDGLKVEVVRELR
jgi:6-pyruvoyl-tetrahydropterin synthase